MTTVKAKQERFQRLFQNLNGTNVVCKNKSRFMEIPAVASFVEKQTDHDLMWVLLPMWVEAEGGADGGESLDAVNAIVRDLIVGLWPDFKE